MNERKSQIIATNSHFFQENLGTIAKENNIFFLNFTQIDSRFVQ